ncbi:hypothetical protein niasHT_016146 [Heterodera trifolii]|uniref:Uncharacterized protein n=1 Tax=Heterodera trifolii TaxID=157864 RepID=A0ABD2LK67_9BILA
MGKRKLKEEPVEEADQGDDDQLTASAQAETTTAQQQNQFREPRLKRIKREEYQQHHHHHSRQQIDVDDVSAAAAAASSSALSLPNGHGHASSSANNHRLLMNGTTAVPTTDGGDNGGGEGGQQQSVWLIRKPINMPMEALHNIHFTRKQSAQCQTISSTSAAKVECHLKKPIRPLLHVISDRKRTFDEKVPMTQGSSLRGVVWVNNIEPVQLQQPQRSRTKTATGDDDVEESGAGTELLQLDDDNDGMDDGICATSSAVPSSSRIQIGSIRRTPVVDEHMLKERLKAFGTAQKKGATTATTEAQRRRRK